jgi:cyanophycin synthetase
LWSRAGAVLDVALTEDEAVRAISVWRIQVKRMLHAVGWGLEETAVRRFKGGASLAISAPIDALYSATEINEWAFAAAEALLLDNPIADVEENAKRLRGLIDAEKRPRLLELDRAANERGVAFVTDAEQTSVGLGAGSLTFSTTSLPFAEDVDWSRVHDVPVVLVTGTNGKSTTVRLLGAIARACGTTAGLSTTDWISIGGELVERGDYSGPEGARRVLRDPRVELAVLETARGGILRRGLAVRRADAALITNVGKDHLGEWGVDDLDALAETKFVVGRAIDARGRLVLNADDPVLVARAREIGVPQAWFALHASNPRIREQLESGGPAFAQVGDVLSRSNGRAWEPIVNVRDLAFTLSGAARHNVSNALAAIALANTLGLPIDGIARGLAEFRSTPEENPGRLNVFDFGGARVVADFAHNPHGMEALFDMVARLPARRRLVILGQAGDRDDESIRELARIAWRVRPDRVVIKEMQEHLRGRRAGEVTTLLADELVRLGAPASAIVRVPSELDAVRESLSWAEPGDLLLLLLHAQRDAALSLLARLQERSWTPGRPLDG